MAKVNKQIKKIWVAVHVERGIVAEIRAYYDEKDAWHQEKSWRRKMNPDYDETAYAGVCLREKSAARS